MRALKTQETISYVFTSYFPHECVCGSTLFHASIKMHLKTAFTCGAGTVNFPESAFVRLKVFKMLFSVDV